MSVTVTFLGSGTSHGVPMIGCSCPTCRSPDPRDKRTNASLLLAGEEGRVLIDCGRDFRQQALRHSLTGLDALLVTHTHFDHVAGIDDLRVFTAQRREPLPLRGLPEHLDYLSRYIFHYLFDGTAQKGGGITSLALTPVEGTFEAAGMLFEPLPVLHGRLGILGYRFLDCAYISDVSSIPEGTLERLQGLEVLILDALRFRPHSTHFSLEEATGIVRRLAPRRAYFTHICHDMMHAAVDPLLRDPGSPFFSGVEAHLACDGLSFTLGSSDS